jgi:hypothetical protein
MSARIVLIILALVMCGINDAAIAATKKYSAKQIENKETARRVVKKKVASQQHRISARLVPPPPAYMPSILPEMYYRSRTVAAVEEDSDEAEEGTPAIAAKPKNPYVKYFYSREGVIPKGTQVRSGVTTWSAPLR